MSGYQTTLERIEDIAEGTTAFHFAKPAGFVFRPGQAVDLTLNDPLATDAQSMGHAFSLCSAPFQAQLTVATRMRDSPFKRLLKALPIGAPVQLDGPFGSLTLHGNRARAAVFVAGGIGITPFVSIVRQATHERLRQRMVLIYSNRRPEDAAFFAEMQQTERDNPNFHLLATMTQMSKSSMPWSGETGWIGEALVRRVVGVLENPIVYVAGPPTMVGSVRETMIAAGVTEEDIRSEEFYGY